MGNQTRRTHGKQQGPRSRRVIESVREATLAELARVGYGQLTMDKVATAAGVHRTTLYRRWPTKQALVASLFEPGLARLQAVPPGDDLAADLEAIAVHLVEDLETPTGRALTALLSSHAPELRELAEGGRQEVLRLFRGAFERAASRGEIPADVDAEVRAHLLFAGVVHWTLDRPEPIPPDTIRRMIAVVLPG